MVIKPPVGTQDSLRRTHVKNHIHEGPTSRTGESEEGNNLWKEITFGKILKNTDTDNTITTLSEYHRRYLRCIYYTKYLLL